MTHAVLKPTAHRHPLQEIPAFRSALVDWFQANGKSYPWRNTKDPYAILVSEVMLQQTTISAVLGKGYYSRFLRTFPDIASLAAAEEAEVLSAWEGLGYYSRARNLQKTARTIVVEHKGIFPNDFDAISALPGIGPYTAGAVSSFAYNHSRPIVDGNVARVLSRLMDFSEPVDKPKALKQLWAWAGELVSPDHPRLYNSALMELGQTHCKKASPECLQCPVNSFCQTHTPSDLPKKTPRKAMTLVDEHVIYCMDSSGDILLQQETGTRRKGMWKLPERPAISSDPILVQPYVITRYKVTLHVYTATEAQARPLSDNEQFFTPEELIKLPMPAPYRKALNKVLG